MRALEIGFIGKHRREIAYPMATAIIMPQIAGVMLSSSNGLAFLALGVFSVLFFVACVSGVRWARRNVGRYYRQDFGPKFP